MNITRALATSILIACIVACLAETGLRRQMGAASGQLTSYSTATSYMTTTLQITRVTTSYRIQYVTSTTLEYSGNYMAVRVYYSGVNVRNIGSERIEEGVVVLRKPKAGDMSVDFTRLEPGESKIFFSQTPTVDYYPIWAAVRFLYPSGPGVGQLREVSDPLTLTPLRNTTSYTAATISIPYTEMRESIVTQIISVPVTVARGTTPTDVIGLLIVAILLAAPLSVLVYTRMRKKAPAPPPVPVREIATMITCDFMRVTEENQLKGVLSGRLTRSDTGEGLGNRPLQLRLISSEYLMFDLNTDSEGHWRFEHEMLTAPDIMWSANISFQGEPTFSRCAASTIQANK